MTPDEAMRAIDQQLSHIWMVRTFLKHSEEAEEYDELCDVYRGLYDYVLALGPAWREQNAAEYLKLARKKYSKLKQTAEKFSQLQPEVSAHTNFQMAAASLQAAVGQIGQLLASVETG